MRARQMGVVRCHGCGMVCEDVHGAGEPARCPRCSTTLRHRHHDSLSRAWALLLAAVILYVPANIMPVMHTLSPGSSSDSTILQGVIDFWQSGSHGIAVLVFAASFLVPGAKFLSLALLLLTTQYRSGWARRERTRLYRLVELISYWSMLDVLVIAIVAALIKFQILGDIEPRIGIFFFGSAVILTMLSATSFDPRLIWDGGVTND